MDGSLWRAAPPTQITALQSAPGEISSHHRGVDTGTAPSCLLGIEEAGEFYVERGETWNILTFSAKITGNLWMGWVREGWLGYKGLGAWRVRGSPLPQKAAAGHPAPPGQAHGEGPSTLLPLCGRRRQKAAEKQQIGGPLLPAKLRTGVTLAHKPSTLPEHVLPAENLLPQHWLHSSWKNKEMKQRCPF